MCGMNLKEFLHPLYIFSNLSPIKIYKYLRDKHTIFFIHEFLLIYTLLLLRLRYYLIFMKHYILKNLLRSMCILCMGDKPQRISSPSLNLRRDPKSNSKIFLQILLPLKLKNTRVIYQTSILYIFFFLLSRII